MKVAFLGLAGAAGTLTRYAIAVAVGTRSFPWATLAINLTGSFVLGLLLTVGVERQWSETAIEPLAIGFLGAYTTFSTFSYESFALLRADRVPTAMLYVAVSVAGGLTAAAFGYLVGRRVA